MTYSIRQRRNGPLGNRKSMTDAPKLSRYVLFNAQGGVPASVSEWLREVDATCVQYDSPEEANKTVEWSEIAGVIVSAGSSIGGTVELAKEIRAQLTRPDIPILVL